MLSQGGLKLPMVTLKEWLLTGHENLKFLTCSVHFSLATCSFDLHSYNPTMDLAPSSHVTKRKTKSTVGQEGPGGHSKWTPFLRGSRGCMLVLFLADLVGTSSLLPCLANVITVA